MEEDILDLDELVALQEQEESRLGGRECNLAHGEKQSRDPCIDDDEDAMEVLREIEAERGLDDRAMEDDETEMALLREIEADREAKENRAKRSLFQSPRNHHPGGEPEKKRPRKDIEVLATVNTNKVTNTETPDGADQTLSSQNLMKRLATHKQRKVLRRVPFGDFQAVTTCDGDRYYLRVLEKQEESCEFSETTVPGRLGNLCGAPFHELVAAAQEERVLADQLDDDNMIDGSNSSNSMLGSQHLWEEKFRPKSFKELLSDDGINRTLLHWLKLWDKVVFNRDVKKRRVAVNQDKGWKPKVGSGKAATVNEMEDELDDNGRPLKMVSLLHGAPGLGKTTLAHVIANHAGYNVVEINASDDRSLAVFKTKFEAATQMRSVSGRDQRPNCLILDEIDGAPLPTINFLVDCIQGKGKGKGKKYASLQRPIICICNDLYVPSLRPLKPFCFTLSFPPTLSSRLSERLMELAREEGLCTDMTALLTLCNKTENDIRACLSTLQFFKSKRAELRIQDVAKANVGLKDCQKSLFVVWREIFEMPAITNKRPQTGDMLSCSSRFSTILRSAQSCGDYDKLLQGVFENYTHVKFKDVMLLNVNHSLGWMCFLDMVQHNIAVSQTYVLMGYMPYAFVALHLLLAAFSKASLSYPTTQWSKQQQTNKGKGMTSAMISEMDVKCKSYVTSASLVFDIIPNLLSIIQPNLRPVNTQLYSAAEKEQMQTLVKVMLNFNLTYQQERSPDGQYVYKLDPPLDDIGCFPGIRHHSLPYALKQVIAREVGMERMRKEEQEKAEPSVAKARVQDSKSPLPSHLQRLRAKEINVKDKNPVDFFGRKITTPAKDSRRDKENTDNVQRIVCSDIWFKFKEGYNNAVRRNLKLQDL